MDTPGASGLLHRNLSHSEYLRLSKLLDESLEMAPETRSSWLQELARSDPQSAALLRDLFASQDASQAEQFLETPDLLRRRLEPFGAVDEGLTGKIFGPYRVLSPLGYGGMGSVWLAERADGLFTRRVALKLIHPALKSRVTSERFTREREILASLSHPNIARLLDAGFSEDGQSYLALDYVAGAPLTSYCDERRLAIRERLELFRQVLSAVQYAHAHLVIHRDLKPANILVTEEGQVQLLDFGIAKLLSEGEAKETELTQLGGRALTLDYAAPEQIAGAPVTTAADVYALGVMLYELLTGERPYKLKRDSRGALEEAILQVDPVTPSRAALSGAAAAARATSPTKLSSTLRGDLDTIAIKALKKAPAERYATANAFGEDIERFLRGDVVLAQPDSVAYHALKFARRYRIAFAAASVLMLTLAGGLAATSYEARVASAQRDAALDARSRALTQTAAARLNDGDTPGALGIILEVLPHRGDKRQYTPEALSVFQEARAADAQIRVITGHTDRVISAAFSPDGGRIVTASDDKTARIWDATTGREMIRLSGHADSLNFAAYSPDGRRIVTASYDKTARIWDAATGRQLLLLNGHTGKVRSAAYSPDGTRIVTASNDKTARIWDATSGQQQLVLSGHTETVMSAAFSPDGRRVVTASHDQTARIWDAATGREVTVLRGHDNAVWSAAFSPDGRRIVTSSVDKTARIWDAATGLQTMMLSGHADLVSSAAFSPDGRRVVTASDDKTIRLWDAATGQQTALLSGHTDVIESAVFSPDGRRVVSTSFDLTARLWEAAPVQQIGLLSGHTNMVMSATFSPDGQRIATVSWDKTARIWDAVTGREISVLSGHTDHVESAMFSPDGQHVVTAAKDQTARIWDVATGRESMRLNGHTASVWYAAFSPDGRRVVTASWDKTARIWNVASGREILRLLGHSGNVNSAAFSPDGKRVVTASHDTTARIWDAATGRQLIVLRGHADVVERAVFSADGRRIVTASDDQTARIWDAATGREVVRLIGHAKAVNSAAFSPDGMRVVTSSDDKSARIWDAMTGTQTMLLSGHTDFVRAADFSPDGRRVVTASADKTARIWDARAPALETQIGWVQAAQFDPLPGTARFQLGLPTPADVRQWPADKSKCDESAAAPYDPDRRASGFMLEQIVADIAIGACGGANSRRDGEVRSTYQQGRAFMAQGNFPEARQDFEAAVARGYRSARVDFAMLLLQPSAGMLDLPKAISLYESAWNHGMAIAGYELGKLYEHGVSRPGGSEDYLLAPDNSRAWSWYQKAAAAGEPNALARFADRDDAAASFEVDAAKKNSLWLGSFKYYASASERARIEDWPDEAWRNWRYHRASLAHLLARSGMVREVADAYDEVRKQYAPQPTRWQRLTALVRLDY
jgi:WD40 repeat protein/tRNA A-37 threonylcarbamoyl transferase component Bud32/TPR repeat protein